MLGAGLEWPEFGEPQSGETTHDVGEAGVQRSSSSLLLQTRIAGSSTVRVVELEGWEFVGSARGLCRRKEWRRGCSSLEASGGVVTEMGNFLPPPRRMFREACGAGGSRSACSWATRKSISSSEMLLTWFHQARGP